MISDLFVTTGFCLSEIVSLTEETYQRKALRESTKFGKIYLKEINSIAENFTKLNKNLLEEINLIDAKRKDGINRYILKSDIENIVELIDEYESPNILKIMKIVWNNKSFDEEDRKNVHQACTIYSELYSRYENSLNQAKLRQIDLRTIIMKGFKI